MSVDLRKQQDAVACERHSSSYHPRTAVHFNLEASKPGCVSPVDFEVNDGDDAAVREVSSGDGAANAVDDASAQPVGDGGSTAAHSGVEDAALEVDEAK